MRGVDATVKFATAAPDGVKRSSGSAVRFPTTVIVVSPATRPSWCCRGACRARAYAAALTLGSHSVLVGPQHLGPKHGLVQVQLAVELRHRRRLGLHIDDGVDALGVLGDLVCQAPLPHMSTLSTLPPSLRMTLRNVSNDGATVRSSRVGSRMTMISYGRMRTSPPPTV